MLYNLIEIRPSFEGEGWEVTKFDDTDKLNRDEPDNHIPHSMGFFYYPRKWDARKGFQMLKDDTIKRRKEEIKTLQKDLELIEKLEFPSWIPSSKH